MISLWDENIPEEVQRKFYHVAMFELACVGEAANCLTTFFVKEFDNFGRQTGRIIYNPVIDKTSQCGAQPLAQKKWLTANEDKSDHCSVRLFNKFMERRGPHITSKRLFLAPNPAWKR